MTRVLRPNTYRPESFGQQGGRCGHCVESIFWQDGSACATNEVEIKFRQP